MPKSEEKELIKNVRALRNEHGQLLVSSVCQKLQESGFNVAGTLVSYYSPLEEMYIFIGKDPIPAEKDGVSSESLQKNRLLLRFRLPDDTPKAIAPVPEQIPQAPPVQGKYSFSLQPTIEQNVGFGASSFGQPAPEIQQNYMSKLFLG
jgi:hypothetical protein